MKINLKFPLEWLWKFYKIGAFALGTVVLCLVSFGMIKVLLEEKVEWFVVPLHSGFIYEYDMQDGSKDGHNISDQNNNVIVYSDVIRFLESGKTIYGYRKDLQGNPFYFICDYGDDCMDSQHLTDAELRKIVAERDLPLFTPNSGTGRYDLKREMNRFRKEYGEGKKPQWEYDEEWREYRIVGERG